MPPTKSSLAILHHIRWLAALAVAVSHIRQNLLLDHTDVSHPGVIGDLIYFVSAYGHAGVVVFFVLSGFLVGGKAVQLLSSPTIEADWQHFLVDRFTRIFIVLWPALIVTAVILAGVQLLAPQAAFMTLPHWGWAIQNPLDHDFSLKTWAGSAVLLNGLTVPNLHTDAPLWSLAYEWFYYIAALACVVAIRRVFSPGAIVLMVYAVTLLALGLLLNPNMILLAAVWVMGVLARVAFDRRMITGSAVRYACLALLLGLLLVDRFYTVPDLLLGLSLALVVSHAAWSNWNKGVVWGAALADFSYSLYVIHYPISIAVLGVLFKLGMLPKRLPLSTEGIAIAVGTLLLAIALARVFALVTEDRTSDVRRFLLKTMQIQSRKPAPILAAD